jgi:hypothetical protein
MVDHFNRGRYPAVVRRTSGRLRHRQPEAAGRVAATARLAGPAEGTDAGVRFPASSPGLRRPDTAGSSRPEEFPGQVARIGDANPESIAETGRELFDDSSGEEVRVPVSQGVHR